MGTAQVAFVKVERVGATGSHVTRSDVSHVTGNDRKSCDRRGPVRNRKNGMRMRNWKLRNIRLSGAFSPEVTSVTWLEVTGRGPVRKSLGYLWPKVTRRGGMVCACPTGSCAISPSRLFPSSPPPPSQTATATTITTTAVLVVEEEVEGEGRRRYIWV